MKRFFLLVDKEKTFDIPPLRGARGMLLHFICACLKHFLFAHSCVAGNTPLAPRKVEIRHAPAIFFKHTLFAILLSLGCVVYSQEPMPVATTPLDSLAQISADAVAATLRGETETERMFWLRRRAFVESVFEQSTFTMGDSSLFFRFALSAGQLGLDKETLAKIPARPDYVGERLRGQQSGSQGLFNIGELIGRGMKFLAQKIGAAQNLGSPWAIVPSETEIRVMNVLWKGEATSASIYARLDSAKLNYKEVNTVLENMVGRGLVEREQVSPKNELTVLGAFALEMSSLNAKNREYVYRARASRDLMTAYLDASAFSHQSPRSPGESMLQAHLRKLLALLASESEGL